MLAEQAISSHLTRQRTRRAQSIGERCSYSRSTECPRLVVLPVPRKRVPKSSKLRWLRCRNLSRTNESRRLGPRIRRVAASQAPKATAGRCLYRVTRLVTERHLQARIATSRFLCRRHLELNRPWRVREPMVTLLFLQRRLFAASYPLTEERFEDLGVRESSPRRYPFAASRRKTQRCL